MQVDRAALHLPTIHLFTLRLRECLPRFERGQGHGAYASSQLDKIAAVHRCAFRRFLSVSCGISSLWLHIYFLLDSNAMTR